jgi:hypothetical protein
MQREERGCDVMSLTQSNPASEYHGCLRMSSAPFASLPIRLLTSFSIRPCRRDTAAGSMSSGQVNTPFITCSISSNTQAGRQTGDQPS